MNLLSSIAMYSNPIMELIAIYAYEILLYFLILFYENVCFGQC